MVTNSKQISTTTCSRILYTKHLVKRKKTYHDGFLKLDSDRAACLLDENGQKLANAKLPAQMLPLSSETEGSQLACYCALIYIRAFQSR